jgi:hypothetical protein
MEVVSLRIAVDSEELHTSTNTAAETFDLASAEGRRAFMSGTIEGLKKLKENSDQCLTVLIDKIKGEAAMIAKVQEP